MNTLQDLVFIHTASNHDFPDTSMGWCKSSLEGLLVLEPLNPDAQERDMARQILEVCCRERTDPDTSRKFFVRAPDGRLHITTTEPLDHNRILGKIYSAAYKSSPAPLAMCSVGNYTVLFRKYMYAFAIPLSAMGLLAEVDRRTIIDGGTPDRLDCWLPAKCKTPLERNSEWLIVSGDLSVPVQSFDDMVHAIQQVTDTQISDSAIELINEVLDSDDMVRDCPMQHDKVRLWRHKEGDKLFAGERCFLPDMSKRPYAPYGYLLPRLWDRSAGAVAQFYEADKPFLIVRRFS